MAHMPTFDGDGRINGLQADRISHFSLSPCAQSQGHFRQDSGQASHLHSEAALFRLHSCALGRG